MLDHGMLNFALSKIEEEYKNMDSIQGYKQIPDNEWRNYANVTEMNPDIVITNDKDQTVDIFKLTVPFESNI